MKGAPALGWESTEEEDTMNTMLLKMYIKLQNLMSREEGQDLVEYAMLIALIAFGATAGMSKLATGISTALSNISVQLSTNIT